MNLLIVAFYQTEKIKKKKIRPGPIWVNFKLAASELMPFNEVTVG